MCDTDAESRSYYNQVKYKTRHSTSSLQFSLVQSVSIDNFEQLRTKRKVVLREQKLLPITSMVQETAVADFSGFS